MSSTFDLFDGHFGGQHGCATHVTHQNDCHFDSNFEGRGDGDAQQTVMVLESALGTHCLRISVQ